MTDQKIKTQRNRVITANSIMAVIVEFAARNIFRTSIEKSPLKVTVCV